MFRVLLASIKRRHAWDRIKCVIATGVPAFWVLVIVLRSSLPAAAAASVPHWLAAQTQPLLEDIPAMWAIAISLVVASFQWYNLAHFQRRVIPLVREMYDRALAKRDPELLTMLSQALRLGRLRDSVRGFFRNVSSMFR